MLSEFRYLKIHEILPKMMCCENYRLAHKIRSESLADQAVLVVSYIHSFLRSLPLNNGQKESKKHLEIICYTFYISQ